MNILNQLSGKINGKFAMFDRIVINGYLLSLINTNSFSYIDDYDRAQKLADNFLNKKLSGALENLVSKINIHYQKIKELNNDSYYYCVNQCEFAVDYSFNSCEDLNLIYKKLAETAFYTLKCDNVYSFFGRNIKYINRTKNVDLTSNLKNWDQGYRIKFKLNKNQVKMYNKGNNLRIEVTINNPKAFKVLKDLPNDITCDNDDNNKVNKKKFVPMGKSISNFYRYAEVSKSIIDRFVDSLPMLDIEENVPKEDIQKISERTTVNERNYSAFNLLNRDNITLFSVISDGKYLIHGFTNKSIILEVFDEASKRNINKLTRLLAKLRAFGIIKKIDHRNTYFLTDFGRRICNSILLYVNKDLLGF